VSGQEALNYPCTKFGWAVMNRPAQPFAQMIGFDAPIVVELKAHITAQQQSVLHVLGEFPNRFVTQAELRQRLGAENLAIRIHVCRLRKHLTHDWTIQFAPGRGYRLIDMRDK
jgi:DNA-binding response OmpR family regulator